MVVDVVYYTGRGNVRRENEDSLLIGRKTFNSIDMHQVEKERIDKGIFAVADGMGGYIGGAIASGIIVDELSKICDLTIDEVLEKVKDRMEKRAHKEYLLSHMGSVLTGIQIKEKRVLVFNIGDSKTFLYRKGLTLVTRDDSLVWELLRDKYKEPRELHDTIRKHPKKNIVTSAVMLGKEKFNLQKDIIEIEDGDRYLICSDGLWEEVSYEYIERCMKLEIKLSGEELLREASIEGKDNISFIIVEINDK